VGWYSCTCLTIITNCRVNLDELSESRTARHDQ